MKNVHVCSIKSKKMYIKTNLKGAIIIPYNLQTVFEKLYYIL